MVPMKPFYTVNKPQTKTWNILCTSSKKYYNQIFNIELFPFTTVFVLLFFRFESPHIMCFLSHPYLSTVNTEELMVWTEWKVYSMAFI